MHDSRQFDPCQCLRSLVMGPRGLLLSSKMDLLASFRWNWPQGRRGEKWGPAQSELRFREIIEIADDASGDYVTTSDGKTIVDHENIQRSRLRVDARQWAAARLAPKKYGDRVEHDHKGGLNFQPAVLVQVGGEQPTTLQKISSDDWSDYDRDGPEE